MERHCLIINDDSIIEKLEYFIYDYSSVKYNDVNIILNHFTCSNINDMKSLKDIDNYELRKILLFNSHPFNNIDRTTVEKAIDLFLLFLRTYNMEASINLNKLIELIWVTGNEGHQWECIKRITGILSAIYSLYFADKAIIFDKSVTEQEMIRICYKNSRFYTKEDKNFLLNIFLNERKYDYLLEILLLDLEFVQHTESITLESQKKIVNSYIRFLKSIKETKDYDDELLFLEKSERILNLISDKNLTQFFNDYLKTEQAKILFDLKRFEEAKNIQIEYIKNKSGQDNNVYEIYNCAIFYAWAADRKEKDDPERKEYFEKAYDMISKAEEYVNQNNLSNEEFKNELLDKELINYILFEKSFLLSEFNDYTNAFEYFCRAYSNSIKHITSNSRQHAAIIDSNFNTHFWILMKYMCLNRDEYKTVKSIIEELYSKFGHKVPKEYSAILNFMHTNEYLNAKRDEKIYDNIYINLLMLMFRSLEIKHETKICDVSKYDILYYTKIEHLRLLLEDETKQNCHYRLPMFHVYHMNDPQEGRLIQNLLQKDKFIVFDDSPIQNSRTFSEENFIFLKSFFCYRKNDKNNINEFLPMWVQYGDDAKGCCIVLDEKTFQNNALRKIIYLTDDGKCEEKDKNIEIILHEFQQTYHELLSICNEEIDIKSESGRECYFGIESLTNYIVSQISYLFKDQSYKHENEVRLIISKANNDLDDINVIGGSVPKIFLYNDCQTYIKEIILGTKIENPENYVPFIYKQGKKMWKDYEPTQIKVTKSAIQYK